MRLTRDDRITVAAHRGDSYNYYENTMTAFKMAVEAGADMIETDVRLTSDNIPILIHDDKIDRTTNGKGSVSLYTFSQIQEFNAGDEYNVEHIPTFEEFIDWASKENITLNIELKEYYVKGNEDRCIDCIEQVVCLVEKYCMTDRIVFNSFDAWILEYIYRKYGRKYLLHGFYPYTEMFNVNIDPTEFLYCACIWDIYNDNIYDFLKSNNIEPWIGASVTQKSKLDICIKKGAKLITTNNPRDIFEKIL